MGVGVEPSSEVGWPAGPQPYTLGHCGIFSGIDADGSWWDPVGPVDMDSGDAVNATEGVLNLTDPTHGTFVAPERLRRPAPAARRGQGPAAVHVIARRTRSVPR